MGIRFTLQGIHVKEYVDLLRLSHLRCHGAGLRPGNPVGVTSHQSMPSRRLSM